MTTAVTIPATIASAIVVGPLQCSTTSERMAAALAPDVMPITSGLARGFRSIVWKVDPATPKAMPARTPVSARGNRNVPTVKDAPCTCCPKRTATTSDTG